MAGSLLSNWVFAYDVPLTVQIVFRSGSKFCMWQRILANAIPSGLAVSMLFGYLFSKKTYNGRQIVSLTTILL